MKRKMPIFLAPMLMVLGLQLSAHAQSSDSTAHNQPKQYKNIIRYNISSPLLFGFDKYIILGYERQLRKNQSFSINLGRAALPRLVEIVSDSSNLKRDTKNTGFNFSVDYRFYLNKENRYAAPHGVYIGPYYAFTTFTRDNDHYLKRSNGNLDLATSQTTFTINNIGFELGYQFVLWKRLALDMLLIGPGVSSYHITSTLQGSLSDKDKVNMREDVREMLKQKFPGMNLVLGEKHFDTEGVIQNWDVGFRYLIHIGFMF
jgi:hypothetical protein